MVTSFTMVFFSVYLYTSKVNAVSLNTAFFSDTMLWSGAVAFTTFWNLCFFIFLGCIKSEYIETFYTTKRGKDLSMAYFLDHDEDEIRSNVFLCNQKHWLSIRDKVKAWTLANFDDWFENEEPWLDEALISAIPEDFIPKGTLEEILKKRELMIKEGKAGGKLQERRYSIGAIALGISNATDEPRAMRGTMRGTRGSRGSRGSRDSRGSRGSGNAWFLQTPNKVHNAPINIGVAPGSKPQAGPHGHSRGYHTNRQWLPSYLDIKRGEKELIKEAEKQNTERSDNEKKSKNGVLSSLRGKLLSKVTPESKDRDLEEAEGIISSIVSSEYSSSVRSDR